MRTENFSYPVGGLPIPFSLDAALVSLPAYCNSHRTASLLDPLVEFLNDGNYVMGVRSVPSTQQQNNSNLIQANQTYEDNINVPAGSYLLMVGGFGIQDDMVTAGDFRCRLFDVGSQSYLSDDFVHAQNISGFITGTLQSNAGEQPNFGWRINPGNPNNVGRSNRPLVGLHILQAPIAISSPGQLNVQIVNLDSVEITVDMAFYFAIPVSNHIGVGPANVSGNFNRSSIR